MVIQWYKIERLVQILVKIFYDFKIVDPWGKVIANCEEESPSFKIADVDLDYLDSVRDSIPVLNSVRPDLYIQLPIVKSK